MIFQSTHLKRGATCRTSWQKVLKRFQSTHLKRGATKCHPCSRAFLHFNPRTSNEVRLKPFRMPFTTFISIHAPQTRCDHWFSGKRLTCAYFNPRTSNEVRQVGDQITVSADDFNPRTSNEVRRASRALRGAQKNFNPRTSNEVRLERDVSTYDLDISIHAPQTRCDPWEPLRSAI